MDNQYASVLYVNLLFAFFCVYWAQQTGRSRVLWFVLGLALGPIAGVSLVIKNGDDRRAAGSA